MHQYVSSDPSVNVSGTEIHRPSQAIELEGRLNSPILTRIAVESAHRAAPDSASQRGPLRAEVMRFMLRNSRYSSTQIAEQFGVTRQSTWDLSQSRTPSEPRDAVVRKILSDARILSQRTLSLRYVKDGSR